MPSFQQQKKQQLEKPQSLIDPDEFSLRLIQVLNKDYPDFGEWNGASGMEILKQTTGFTCTIVACRAPQFL